jgi:hypothetical protein
MNRKDESTVKRLNGYNRQFGDVTFSQAIDSITNKDRTPGRRPKWADDNALLLYCAIEDWIDKGDAIRASCRYLASGTVHTPKEIEGIYRRTKEKYGRLINKILKGRRNRVEFFFKN